MNPSNPTNLADAGEILGLTNEAIVAVAPDGRVTFANPKAHSLFGYEDADLRGCDWVTACFPASVRSDARGAFDRVVGEETGSETVEEYELPVLTASGGEQPVLWRTTPLRDDAGNVLGTLNTGVEVDRRRSAASTPDDNLRHYRTLIDQFPNGLVTLFDSDLRYQIVGGEGFDGVGISPTDLEGDRLQDVFPPENVSALEPLYRQALNGESSVTEQTLDGRVFRIHIVPIRDEGIVAGMTVSQDVTEKRQTERDLRERELHLSQAQEIADIGSWALDFETEDLYWSEECYSIFGLSEDAELNYQRFLDRVHPDDREMVDEQWSAALDGAQYDIEHRILVDSEVKWVHERAAFDRDEDGTPRAAVGVIQDTTDRKRSEQELERTKRRYRTLLEAAPTPIFVADVQTGELVETNRAAEELYGRPRAELIGSHQSVLHPSEDEAAYRELFESHVDGEETARTLPDGSQIYLVAADGERIPIEITTTVVEFDDESVIYGLFRDISEQLAYERSLAGLNEAAQRLFEARTTEAIDEQVVQTVTDVLDIPHVAVYRFDEVDGILSSVNCRGPDEFDGHPDRPDVGPDDGTIWDAFVTGETVADDVGPNGSGLGGETPLRSRLVVPIEDYGVLVIGDTDVGRFDDRTVNLVEILVATAESAFERTEREQKLQQREQKLETRTRELEQAEAINTQIRNVARAIVDADTRADVANAVCSHLVKADPFEFAWFGRVDPVEESVEPQAWAGTGQQYLDHFDGSIVDTETAEPSIRAVRTNEPVVVSTMAKRLAAVPWRQQSLRYGFQSALSLPLLYQGSLQGVFTIYANTTAAFDETLRDVLSELADLIAHALVAIDRKQALLSNQMVELEFEINDRSCFFLRFPQDVGCRLELEGMIPQSDESTLVFARIHDADPETLIDRAQGSPEIQNARIIESNESTLIQVELTNQFIGSYLADHGITLQDITADDTRCQVTLTVPPSYDIRRVVDVVTARYTDSKLRAKRDRTDDFEGHTFTQGVLERLTPRQREVVELAYHSGYFDSPKEATGAELADILEISNSTFHGHLRAAERTLLASLFDDLE